MAAANIAPDGTLIGTQTALFGHANEGIMALQYDISGAWAYEFNVGRHHGESGGPVFVQDPLAAVAVMQFYFQGRTGIDLDRAELPPQMLKGGLLVGLGFLARLALEPYPARFDAHPSSS